MTLPFRILNVFTVAGDPFSGNPLCVFEDGSDLDDGAMLALARQFNLSETTFILAPRNADADARVRIFTPSFEMPFAGHPTLGTAHVVADLQKKPDRLTLEMIAGRVDVRHESDGSESRWTLHAAREPETRAPAASRAELASMLGVATSAIGEAPLWVDTGSEQLVIPLASPADVARAQPKAEALALHGFSNKRGASMAYVWAMAGDDESGVVARFFFIANGSVVEDPATGSACANLGGWMIATGKQAPLSLRVSQGERVGRPSLLRLEVDREHRIYVGGNVREIGRGSIALDAITRR